MVSSMPRKLPPTPVTTPAATAPALRGPSAHEVAATRAAAFETLEALAKDAMPANTRRALASALRYWSLWHRATFGTELPLLATPRAAVPPETVQIFVAHHTARLRQGAVVAGMPAEVRRRLEALAAAEGVPLVARRVAHRRRTDPAATVGTGAPRAVAADVPALKTMQQRVSLLAKLHGLAKLPRPHDHDARIKTALRDAAKATALRVTEALPEPKTAFTEAEFAQLLDACAADPCRWLGVRDRAMLLCAYAGGGRRRAEVSAMTLERLRLSQAALPDGREVRAYAWSLDAMKRRAATDASGTVFEMWLVGPVVDALTAWLDVLNREGITAGPVWRRVHKRRLTTRERQALERSAETSGVAIATLWPWAVGRAGVKEEALWEVVKRRAVEAGLDPRRFGAHSVRASFSTDMLKAGIGELAVMGMTGHQRVESLKPYDRREIIDNPALALLADKT